jgi:hypothetical protein
MDIIRGNQRLSGQTMLEKAPSVQLPPEPAHTLSSRRTSRVCLFAQNRLRFSRGLSHA